MELPPSVSCAVAVAKSVKKNFFPESNGITYSESSSTLRESLFNCANERNGGVELSSIIPDGVFSQPAKNRRKIPRNAMFKK
jgi:hypothetical protein